MAHTPASPTAGSVRLTVQHGSGPPVEYALTQEEFVLGTVPGCDLRLGDSGLPQIIAVIARHPEGVRLRKLAPATPLKLNGQPVQSALLHHGDRLTLGSMVLEIAIGPAAAALAPPARDAARGLETGAIGFIPIDPDRKPRSPAPAPVPAADSAPDWKIDVTEAEVYEYPAVRPDPGPMLEAFDLETAATVPTSVPIPLPEPRPEPAQPRQMDLPEGEARSRMAELDRMREELTHARRELHQRYQERRDRLSGLQQAVQHAARKLQERKRQVEQESVRLQARQAEYDSRQFELETRLTDLEARERALVRERLVTDEEHLERETRHAEAVRLMEERLADCAEREQRCQDLENRYQLDLARIDRLQSTLETRERQLEARSQEIDRRCEQLRRDTAELEEQARALDLAQEHARDESERLRAQRSEMDEASQRLAERTAMVEGQQAMLAALRIRIDRLRDEARQEAQALADQRARQDEIERSLAERERACAERIESHEVELQASAQLKEHFETRSAALREAVTRLRDLQDQLNAENQALQERRAELERITREQDERAGDIETRLEELRRVQLKVESDRIALHERESTLFQGDEARQALQDQLLRRAEELGRWQKQLEDQARESERKHALFEQTRSGLDESRQQTEAALEAARGELELRSRELQELAERLARREEAQQRQTERLKEVGQTLAAERKTHFELQARWKAEQQSARADAEQNHAELKRLREEIAAEAAGLRKVLPDLEERGVELLQRLSQGREQIRAHLAELHDYARQSQEDLEALRGQIQAESERLRQQELGVQRARGEHRLAVSAFRQQLIEWQGRVAEMRQTLTHDGSLLERRHAEVAEAARQVDANSQHLARQAEQLRQQEREVGAARDLMEHHLSDMREWYRRKLRELAQGGTPPRDSHELADVVPWSRAEVPANPSHAPLGSAAGDPTVLSLTEDLDPGDRRLGELLRSLELIDEDTLTALLLESRRQRRSLRQVLLSAHGGIAAPLTLYQLALIEAGNLDGLVLGRLRVIDRLPSTPREAAYRVHDPEGAGSALLRHLAESEMHDAIHPDEFRQRFAALAALDAPHLARTQEVLEIHDRPAVLQEWLTGLPSNEWPHLVAVPGVWARVLTQAALGLNAAHQAGLVHGHLTSRTIVLTRDGLVKITGCGEPAWLRGGHADAAPADDLAALGELAAAWSVLVPRRKNARPKPLPKPLHRILDRLRSRDADRYASAQELLDDLMGASAEFPHDAESWEKLLQYTVENASESVSWRKSA